MGKLKLNFEKFDERAKALDVAIEELLNHLNVDKNWLPLSSSSLSRVGIDLNDETDETPTRYAFHTRLYLLFYLKNILRYLVFIFEFFTFKFVNFFKFKRLVETPDGIQLVETFLMTNRVMQDDFSDQFTSHIEVPK